MWTLGRRTRESEELAGRKDKTRQFGLLILIYKNESWQRWFGESESYTAEVLLVGGSSKSTIHMNTSLGNIAKDT